MGNRINWLNEKRGLFFVLPDIRFKIAMALELLRAWESSLPLIGLISTFPR